MKNANSETNQISIAIVGGGVAGLVAALESQRLLGANNCSITIYEKAQALGGRASTAHKEGFAINQGPHALYNGGAAHKYLEKHNLLPAGGSPGITGGKVIYKGGIFALPADLASIILTKYLNLEEKCELGFFFQKLPALDIEGRSTENFSQYLKANIKSQMVRDTIETFARLSTYSNSMGMMAATPTLAQLRLAFAGVTYLDGGWQSIVDALSAKLSEGANPVTFRLGQEVTELRQRSGTITVTTAQRENQYDAVFLCLPPRAILRITQDLAQSKIDALSQITPSNIACYDVCLTKLSDEKITFALGIDAPLYYSVHSKGAKLAPEGRALIHLAYYLKDREHGNGSHKNRLQNLIDQLQPGWRENLVYERFLPNMVASFGMPSTATSGHMGLPNPRLLDQLESRIYACGDFVGSGHMLVDASVQSACEAAALLAQDLAASRRIHGVAAINA